MIDSEIDKFAKIIWSYMFMNQTLSKSDVIIRLGTYDIRVGLSNISRIPDEVWGAYEFLVKKGYHKRIVNN
jgi:hypothetical protein